MKTKEAPERDGEVSFGELYDRHFNAVNRYLRYRMDNSWDADDLTAAVFLKALENFHQFRRESNFAVWLFRIAHNAYIDYLRGRRERVFSEDELALLEAPSGPEEALLHTEEVRQLKDMLRRLPPEQRDVISLRYAGELKFGQIAPVLGKSEAAVRMIHHRALKTLRANYSGHGEEAGKIVR
ncbi:RNA polymerase subunit sigma-24 [Desulfotomaculum copahuensis]|uniref:RNA polymerase subunit sigma-24 n=1 Tax=Desulfotomaculum copahuensis TaxID=1838280 RepID=A0A1B7LGE7_9FIRM|nr:sigma-70 family RNA polymerase sigma factor [Desulfotomaculum copahuensis]OAT85030.1 RNA polymerase subunit sigma-24 [Desulfotomaculum copahuensis]